jgi:cytochrome P450
MTDSRHNLAEFRADPIGFLCRLALEGDFVRFRMARREFVLVNRPDLIRDVLTTRQSSFEKGPGLLRTEPILGEGLLTASNARHRRTRRLTQPAFSRDAVAGHMPAMAGEVERWLGDRRDGEALDLHREMTRLTLSIAGRALFGTDLADAADALYGDVGEVVAELYAGLTEAERPGDGARNRRLPPQPLPRGGVSEQMRGAITSSETPPLGRGQGWEPAGQLGDRHEPLRARLERLALCPAHSGSAISESGSPLLGRGGSETLLRLLMRAHEFGDLTERELADEAVTFLLAAHESVSNALVWTFVLLAQNPEAEARLHAELDECFGEIEPSGGDLTDLPYTRAVIHESLRVHPPAWMMSRRASEAARIGDEELAPETIVVAAQCVTHSDPRYWEDAAAFRPERWLSGGDVVCPAPKFAYFPFGAGARACIGERFALQELALAVAAIARRWRVVLQPGAVVEPQPIVTLRPKHGCPVTLVARNLPPAR